MTDNNPGRFQSQVTLAFGEALSYPFTVSTASEDSIKLFQFFCVPMFQGQMIVNDGMANLFSVTQNISGTFSKVGTFGTIVSESQGADLFFNRLAISRQISRLGMLHYTFT